MTYTKDNIVFEPIPTDRRFLNLTGMTFGFRVILGFAGREGVRKMWWCECECGNIGKADTHNLRKGTSDNCGCKRGTHRLSRHPLYKLWQGMMTRCYNPHYIQYEGYGGRGITVCQRWHSFENFFEDMDPRPNGMTLERKDNNLGYSPENCEWASYLVQGNNKQNTIYHTFNDRSHTLPQWCRILNIPYTRTRSRMARGWSFEDAIAIPHVSKSEAAYRGVLSRCGVSIEHHQSYYAEA